MAEAIATQTAAPAQVTAPAPATPAPVETKTPAVADPKVTGQAETPAVPEADPVLKAFGGKTGDAALDLSLGFFASHGYTAESPAAKAALEGDFSLLKAEMAAKGIAGAAEYIKLAEDGYARQAEAHEAKEAATRELVYDAVGGEEAWAEVHDWAKANIAPDAHADINKALLGGGIMAAAMASYLRNEMVNAGEVAPVNPVTGEAVAAATSNGGKLTAAEYQQAVRELAKKMGGNIDGTPEYAALQKRFLR